MSEYYSHEHTEWAIDALQDVSRTFALSLQYLPTPVETYISNSYLLCRIPDTIEDSNKISSQKKSELLNSFSNTLRDNQTPYQFTTAVSTTLSEEMISNSDWKLVMESPKSYQLFKSFPRDIQSSITPWAIELTDGMDEFVSRYSDSEGIRIQTVDELEEYCYYVAGTVGHLITDTVSAEYGLTVTDTIYQAAEEYGLFLQLINIVKDVYDDYKVENNIYVPNKMLQSYGSSHSQLFQNKTAVEKSVLEIVDMCEEYMSSAREMLDWFSTAGDRGIFTSMAIPYLLGVATIRDVTENLELSHEPTEVKITKKDVFKIISLITDTDGESILDIERRIHTRDLM